MFNYEGQLCVHCGNPCENDDDQVWEKYWRFRIMDRAEDTDSAMATVLVELWNTSFEEKKVGTRVAGVYVERV